MDHPDDNQTEEKVESALAAADADVKKGWKTLLLRIALAVLRSTVSALTVKPVAASSMSTNVFPQGFHDSAWASSTYTLTVSGSGEAMLVSAKECWRLTGIRDTQNGQIQARLLSGQRQDCGVVVFSFAVYGQVEARILFSDQRAVPLVTDVLDLRR